MDEDKRGIPRILKIGVTISVFALLLVGFFAWNYNVERSLYLCLRCGRQVIIRKHYFSWEQDDLLELKGGKIEYERPSILEKVLNYRGKCDHDLPAHKKPWTFGGEGTTGDENCLLPVEGNVKGLFGDYRSHWTGIGQEYHFYMPGYEIQAPYDRSWKMRFGKYLEDRMKSDPNFAKRFQGDLWDTSIALPFSFANEVINNFETSGTATR